MVIAPLYLIPRGASQANRTAAAPLAGTASRDAHSGCTGSGFRYNDGRWFGSEANWKSNYNALLG